MKPTTFSHSEMTSLMAARPKAIFEHNTKQEPRETRRTVGQDLSFPNKTSTFWSHKTQIALKEAFELENNIVVNGKIITANYQNAKPSRHAIKLQYENGSMWIAEHVMGLLTATDHIATVDMIGGTSWPTEKTCMQEYYDALTINSKETDMPISYVTPAAPIFIPGPAGSYVAMLPAENGDKRLCIDLMVNYPGESIGKQRIVVDIDDEIVAKIVGARPPSHGWRAGLLPIVSKTPGIRRIVNIHPDNTLRFSNDELTNPRPEYWAKNGSDKKHYIELVLHELLDKMGALGLAGEGRKIAGTLVCYKANHAMDLACVRAIMQGGYDKV